MQFQILQCNPKSLVFLFSLTCTTNRRISFSHQNERWKEKPCSWLKGNKMGKTEYTNTEKCKSENGYRESSTRVKALERREVSSGMNSGSPEVQVHVFRKKERWVRLRCESSDWWSKLKKKKRNFLNSKTERERNRAKYRTCFLWRRYLHQWSLHVELLRLVWSCFAYSFRSLLTLSTLTSDTQRLTIHHSHVPLLPLTLHQIKLNHVYNSFPWNDLLRIDFRWISPMFDFMLQNCSYLILDFLNWSNFK